jgi:HrpA-like RNA helicase
VDVQLLGSADFGCSEEILTIAAVTSVQVRPFSDRLGADLRHSKSFRSEKTGISLSRQSWSAVSS